MRRNLVVRSSRMTVRGTTALALAVLLGSLGAVPAGAAPDPGGGGRTTTSASALTAKLAGGTKSTRITLITGDTVTYTKDAEGRVSATLEAAPGRSRITYKARQEERGYYLIPDDAQVRITAGALDKELFNLDYLAANAYADDRAPQLPLIVRYRQKAGTAALATEARRLPGHAASRALVSVNGAAVKVNKKQAGKFWDDVFGKRGSVGHGLHKVWLDTKVKTFDETSNRQIGAATAWAAGFDGKDVTVGVIDTGIDRNHPDLTGKVVAARNFVPAGYPGGGNPDDATDRHGHGTHVASIAAGTGDASGGRHKGVAPAGNLAIAKALGDDGSGRMSWIIEAMQWQAATQRSRIVSMSLGGPGDSNSAQCQALDSLSAQYGTLFVVAAGNDGPGSYTIGAPGSCTAALTVGAVDSADQVADFSSRGPRVNDHAVKPEITAPGVDTIAARAAGTAMGAPVDDHYTAASGTSMATPHVAGAAAILYQQHPDWTGSQIKAALIGTSRGLGYNPYDQGAGRLDVARASTQRVFHETPSIVGEIIDGDTEVVTKPITYRNDGGAPVTLSLSMNVAEVGGTPAAPGMATLSSDSITIPAQGSASVDLRLDPRFGQGGRYVGLVAAISTTGDRLSVPIAFRKGAPMRTVKIRIDTGRWINPSNLQLWSVGAVRVNDDDPLLQGEPLAWGFGMEWTRVAEGVYEGSIRLPKGGVYEVSTGVFNQDFADGTVEDHYLINPEVRVSEDGAVVAFDTRESARINIETPKPSVSATSAINTHRVSATGREWVSGAVSSYLSTAFRSDWMTPTQAPTIGSFGLVIDDTRIAPQVMLTLQGTTRIELHPLYAYDHSAFLGAPVNRFTTDRRLRVATEADVRAGRNIRDALIMLEPADMSGYPQSYDRFLATIDSATKAGAAGFLSDSGYSRVVGLTSAKPLMWINKETAARVRATLSGAERPWVDVDARIEAPYSYKLNYHLSDRIPDTLTFSPGEKDLATVRATFHNQHPRTTWELGESDFGEVNHTFASGTLMSIRLMHWTLSRTQQVEYYNLTGPDVLWNRERTIYTKSGFDRTASSYRAFVSPGVEEEHWNEVMLPSVAVAGPDTPNVVSPLLFCDGCRQGDALRLRSLRGIGLSPASDASDPSHVYTGSAAVQEETHLYRGGDEVQPHYDWLGLPYYSLPADKGEYRFTQAFREGSSSYPGTRVNTTWTFRTERPNANQVAAPYSCIDTVFGSTEACAWLPIIYPRYHLGVAPDNTAPAGRPHSITVTGQKGPDSAAPLARLQVWISADGGITWKLGEVAPGRDDTFRVAVMNPTLAESPNDTVTIKVKAWDADGNSVEQVVTDAYRLTNPPPLVSSTGKLESGKLAQ